MTDCQFKNENRLRLRKGFTLAEVLITLLIIGVVAALGIPGLITNTQEQEYKVACKSAASKLSQALMQMKQDEGGSLSSYYGNTNSFKPVFMRYFNVIKDCGAVDCIPQTYTSDIYTTLAGYPADTQQFGGEGQFITSDGFFININNTENMDARIFIVVDVNGYTRGPNIYGKDTFGFEVVNDTLKPQGTPGTYINGGCGKTGTSGYQGLGCARNVIRNVDY